jgi:hypothetical protein
LKPLLDLFKVSRYRPAKFGSFDIDTDQTSRGGKANISGTSTTTRQVSTQTQTPSKKSGTVGNIYSLFEKKNGQKGEKLQPDLFPIVKWVSLEDDTRDRNTLEDKAAKFIDEQNLLMINADFRVFADLIEKFHKEYGGAEAIKQTVADVVRGWFEQALVETVMGVQSLKGAPEWPIQYIQAATSEEALTAAVMQRYHITHTVKRELGSKLGKLQHASSE